MIRMNILGTNVLFNTPHELLSFLCSIFTSHYEHFRVHRKAQTPVRVDGPYLPSTHNHCRCFATFVSSAISFSSAILNYRCRRLLSPDLSGQLYQLFYAQTCIVYHHTYSFPSLLALIFSPSL